MFDAELNPSKAFVFDVATAAFQGRREQQEDSLISSFPVGQDAGFAIVADGIGGHVAGHLASAMVTTEVFGHLKMQEANLASGVMNIPFALREAAEQARKRLRAHVERHPDTKGMGSTLLVPVISGDRLSWISIGDSPLYLFRNGALRQLNKDHSMSPQIDIMVKTGALSEEAGKDHPDRNLLTSVIDGDEIATIDCPTTPILLKDGDILIATTDGLQSLSNEAIAAILMQGASGQSMDLVHAFLEAVKKHDDPDQDNTSFAVIKAVATQKAPEVMDLDDLPVLATADGAAVPAEAPVAAAPPPEPEKDERKVYYYRGQKYYRD